jgi:predicted DNA-binding ribbon-helix-helix protein
VPHPQETEYYINIHSVREVSLELQFYAQLQAVSNDHRVTGSSLPTRVVSTSVMLTPRLRSCSSP